MGDVDELSGIEELAASLGYAWPTDDLGQRRVLILMAKTASRWREQVSECQRGIMREKWYEHLRRRLDAMTKKRTAVREAAIEYKRGRDFDALCRTRKLEEALQMIQQWDCLNPPNPELCADHPWLKKLIDDALVK